MKKGNLNDFLNTLKKFGTLWGPVKNGDKFSLKEISDNSEIDHRALRTKIPFKKLLLPPKMSMFSFNNGEAKDNLANIPKQVLFGLHPCDIHAFEIMDNFHMQNFPDPYYIARREQTAVVQLSCIPDEKCFCKTTNTHVSETGFDLALTELTDIFIIWIGSSLGDDMIRECPEIIEENVTHNDMNEYIKWRKHRESSFSLNMDFTGMPSVMELCWDDPIWEELGEKCLSCGSCTLVCPTCPCFDVVDEINLRNTKGERYRKWDSCMFREYSMVAEGHNFRESRAERLKLRFTHKLQAFVGKFGKPACVGCGRCLDICPVDIDIRTVAMHLKGEEVIL